MAFPAKCQTCLPLLLLVLLCAVPVHPTQEIDHERTQQIKEFAATINKELKHTIKKMLDKGDIVPLPGLPTINIDGGRVSISLSLADIVLQGLQDYDLVVQNPFSKGLFDVNAGVGVVFHKISLLVGTYSAGGHIVNLPFNGKGPMHIRLHDFNVGGSIKISLSSCAQRNTTNYQLTQRRTEFQMDHLDEAEGNDLGQLANIVLPSFGQDILKYLQSILNDQSSGHYQAMDKFIFNTVNQIMEDKLGKKCPSDSPSETSETDNLMNIINDIIGDIINKMVNYKVSFDQ